MNRELADIGKSISSFRAKGKRHRKIRFSIFSIQQGTIDEHTLLDHRGLYTDPENFHHFGYALKS